MALAAGTVWEVRTATGSDTNGGGFVAGASGTDYSQQTSPQYSTTAATTAGTTTILWSAASSDMVGNIVYVVGGTGSITAGWYQVISVSAGVSITVDRSSGLTTGTGVTVNLGGALATLTTAIAQAVPSNTIWAKGSQTVTSAVSITQNGTTTPGPPFTITGYTSTRGDGGQFTLQTATNSIDLVDFAGGANQITVNNVIFKSTAGSPGLGIYGSTFTGRGTNIVFNNCRLTGFSTGLVSQYASPEYFLFPALWLNNCEIDNCTNSGLAMSSAVCALNCYFHDNAYGISTSGSGGQTSQALTCVGCVFYNNSTAGVQQASNYPALMQNCAFANNGSAFDYTGSSYDSAWLVNCIFYDNTYGINANSGAINGMVLNCAFGANTTNTNGQTPIAVGTVTLTADPFTNRTGGDFSLNSTSGGGAACKAAGYQSTII